MLDLRRRQFITLLGGVAAWPLAARGQQRERIRRVGLLMPYPKGDAEIEARIRAFRQELGKLGWTDGANVQFDERWPADNMDRVRAEAASLVASNPDAILAAGGRVIPILMQMTRSVPIVLPNASDPIVSGYVTSLARPGGNVTGFSFFELSVIGKILETLKELAPATSRVAVITIPIIPTPSSTGARSRLLPVRLPSSLSPFPFTDLPTLNGPSRAWPIDRTAAFCFLATSRRSLCVTRSSRCSHAAACPRSIPNPFS